MSGIQAYDKKIMQIANIKYGHKAEFEQFH